MRKDKEKTDVCEEHFEKSYSIIGSCPINYRCYDRDCKRCRDRKWEGLVVEKKRCRFGSVPDVDVLFRHEGNMYVVSIWTQMLYPDQLEEQRSGRPHEISIIDHAIMHILLGSGEQIGCGRRSNKNKHLVISRVPWPATPG